MIYFSHRRFYISAIANAKLGAINNSIVRIGSDLKHENPTKRKLKMEIPAYDDVRKYKLLLKEHVETEILYLCITKRKCWKSYNGSGVRWKALIAARSSEIKTTLLFSTDDVDKLAEMCKFYSDLFDLPNNKSFANLIPELGYIGNQGNLPLWWEIISEEDKKIINIKRQKSIVKTCLERYGKHHSMDIALEELHRKLLEMHGVRYPGQVKEIKEKQVKSWRITMMKNYGVDHNSKVPEIREKMEITREKTMLEKYGVKYVSQIEGMGEQIKIKREETMLKKYGVKNISQDPEHNKTVGEKISKAHLAKEKVKCEYCDHTARSIHFHEKHCPNNPNRILTLKLECPHCKKLADPMNAKKWHFDNCKYNPESE